MAWETTCRTWVLVLDRSANAIKNPPKRVWRQVAGMYFAGTPAQDPMMVPVVVFAVGGR